MSQYRRAERRDLCGSPRLPFAADLVLDLPELLWYARP